MAKKEAAGRPRKYNSSYAESVVGYVMLHGRLTTKVLAAIFEVSERTIKDWKSKHEEFRIACNDAKSYLTKLATDSAVSHLKTRTRRREVLSEGGEIVELKEDVLPTHSDVLALKKLGMLKGEIEISKAKVQEIYAAKRSGKISVGEAIEELHLLSIKPPINWIKEAEVELEQLGVESEDEVELVFIKTDRIDNE